LEFLDENWSQINFAKPELLTCEKRNPCVLLSMSHQNLMVKTTVLPPNMLRLELYRVDAQSQTTRDCAQGRT